MSEPARRKGELKGSKPQPGFEQEPPPEATNYNHPTGVGAQASVPGAGVLGSDADAGPKRGDPDATGADRDYPGRPDAKSPLNAPNAPRSRPGTTYSGPDSPPTTGGAGDAGDTPNPNPLATEEVTEGGRSAMNPPDTGPEPGGDRDLPREAVPSPEVQRRRE